MQESQVAELDKAVQNFDDTLSAAIQTFDEPRKAQAIIEFTPDGTILTANDDFLATVGYALDEIQGKHHRIFCDADYAASAEYKAFWARLGEGEYEAAEYQRFRKDGQEIWLSACYNPIVDAKGKVLKVVKFANDITTERNKKAEFQAKFAAISRSQAVIEFELDGTIITANDNFLATVGYTLAEIQGQHHRIFCEPEYASSQEYQEFWERLGNGHFESGEFRRFGKEGQEIWINASYNAVFDANGTPTKVVKFATDITESKNRNAEFEAKARCDRQVASCHRVRT